ncbi:glycosyltransferase [bacterium]|nr:glycosyltransferase [bacterium]
MKIALVGPLPPLRGGIAHYNLSLLETLQERGVELLTVPFRKLYPDILFPGSNQFEPDRMPAEVEGGLLAWRPDTWRHALKQIERFKAERVVYHHWHPFFVPLYRYLMRYHASHGHIVIAHNVLPHEHQTIGKWLNRSLFRKARRVIVGAGSEAELLQRISLGTKAAVMPHPVYDRFRCDLARTKAREDRRYPVDRPVLLHAGLVREYKGLDLLLNAFHKIESQPEPVLHVAGEFYDNPEKYTAAAHAGPACERIWIENRYLSDEELSRLLVAADAVVLPYRHGTQSGIAMAALANGTPVIASAVGALKDVIVDGENGYLVEPRSVDQLHDRIQRFLDEMIPLPTEKRESIANTTMKRYSWEALAELLLEE